MNNKLNKLNFNKSNFLEDNCVKLVNNSNMKKNSLPKTDKIFKLRKPEFKQFTIPQSFLKQLQEFSGGAFCLLIKDEKGEISTYSNFQTSMDFLGMANFGAAYFGTQAGIASQMVSEIASNGADLNERFMGDDED